MWRSNAIAGLAIAGLLYGCQTTTPPEGNRDAPLQTERAVYELQEDDRGNLGVEIPFSYHNRTGKTVYLVNCRGAVPPSLQRWQEGAWETVWSAVRLLCLSPPIEIAPDAVYEDTLRVFAAPHGSNAGPQFEVPEPAGTYRLIWDMAVHDYDFDDPPSGTPLPLSDRVSNSFELLTP